MRIKYIRNVFNYERLVSNEITFVPTTTVRIPERDLGRSKRRSLHLVPVSKRQPLGAAIAV